MKEIHFLAVFFILILMFFGCESGSNLSIEYEKFTLDNGLDVILHIDRSDPITAVAVQYHVGSNREEPQKTGFAHLFEHMMFQESQHVPQDHFFRKIQNAGGTLNGGTWTDGTVYYEVVPNNALEMVLWMEADRMGFLLSTVTPEAFANQQEVVINEKKQHVDNQPYGHTSYIIGKLLYPENHPYNWQVIGATPDLINATLSDVHQFFRKWYKSSNATLVIAGDFDVEQTKKLVEKYFGEIKSDNKVEDLKPMPVKLNETKKVFFEDNFANSPELRIVFPTIESYNKDSYALTLLSELLTNGKKAPLYKVIVEEKKLAPSVRSYQGSKELAGEFQIIIRAFPTANLTDVENAIFESFTKFETEKFTEKDIARIKARIETDFYQGLSSVLSKSFQLAQYNEYAGTPDFLSKDLQNYLDVTLDDIWNVYEKYIKGKNYILTSFVPIGKLDLAVAGSEEFVVESDPIFTKEDLGKLGDGEINLDKIPSSFDRSIEPPAGPDPEIKLPKIYETKFANGMKILGIEHKELPLIQYSITLTGGLLLDEPNKVGVANLISDMLLEGTKNKTPIELEEAIDELGATVDIYTTNESIVLSVSCLSSKFEQINKIVEEILFEPRWDEKEFERLKSETIEQINRNKANPQRLANNIFNKLVYSENHIFSNSTLGTEESVSQISITDLKNFYEKYFSPSMAYISIVGDINESDVVDKFKSLEEKWKAKEFVLPKYPTPPLPEKANVYFVDIPNSKQSQLYVGYISLPYSHSDYYPAYVMNYKLGGSFNGIINLILREEKGWTYGARSTFTGGLNDGTFYVATSVQSSATYESLEIIRDEIIKYRGDVKDEDIEFTKNALVKSNALAFESLYALVNILNNISKYDLPLDYIKQREEFVKNYSKEKHLELAQKYLMPEKMIYLVVGDAATQLAEVKKLGLGSPILLDVNGNKK